MVWNDTLNYLEWIIHGKGVGRTPQEPVGMRPITIIVRNTKQSTKHYHLNQATLLNPLVVARSLTKVGHWHLPCNTVPFVSKIRASSNTPLGPRRWNRRSTYDGMVVACSHLEQGLWPHRGNTVYLVAIRPTACCSQDI